MMMTTTTMMQRRIDAENCHPYGEHNKIHNNKSRPFLDDIDDIH